MESLSETVSLDVATPGPEYFEFIKDVDIRSITLMFNRRISNPSITIEKLTDTPSSMPSSEGSAYSILRISKTFSDGDIDGVIIEFAVPSSWLVSEGVLPDDVKLRRYSGEEWTTLPTMFTSSDVDNYYYEAESPGLSYFSIATAVVESGQVQPVMQEPKPVPGIAGDLPAADCTHYLFMS